MSFNITDIVFESEDSASGFQDDLKKIGESLKETQTQIENLGKDLTAKFTLPLTTAGDLGSDALKKQDTAKEKSDAREFEKQRDIAQLRANGYTDQANALEIQQKAVELQKKYGFEWEKALKYARQLMEESKKGNQDAGYSEKAKSKARDIIGKINSGKLVTDKNTQQEAEDILNGREVDLKSTAFKSEKNRRNRAKKHSRATPRVDLYVPKPPELEEGEESDGGGRNPKGNASGKRNGGNSRGIDELVKLINDLIAHDVSLHGKLDALFPQA